MDPDQGPVSFKYTDIDEVIGTTLRLRITSDRSGSNGTILSQGRNKSVLLSPGLQL